MNGQHIAIGTILLGLMLLAPRAFAQSSNPFDDAQGRHGDGHARQHDIYKHWHPLPTAVKRPLALR